jgi:two-component system, response regulator
MTAASIPSAAARVIDILLVEDSAADREFALRALRKHNPASRVEIAEDGVVALELLHGAAAVRPRVVLLDLQMPRLGGIEMLRQLRADERTCLLPVVVFSSSSEERDLAECYQLGVNSYVVKPGDFEGYERAIIALAQYWTSFNRTVP